MIDGQPLRRGAIRVIPQQGRSAHGEIDSEGKFHLGTYSVNDGCLAGNHAVEVIAFELLDGQRQRWHIPALYRESLRSGLKVSITEPTDELVVDLTWQGSGHNAPYVQSFGEKRKE